MITSIINKILFVFKVPFTGRMTRRSYVLGMIGISLILVFALMVNWFELTHISSFIIVIATINILTTWRRLHDIDLPGFLVMIPWGLFTISCFCGKYYLSKQALFGVPALLFTFIIVCSFLLMLIPGDPDPNNYGDNPRDNTILPHDLDNDNSNFENKKKDPYDRFKW